MVSCTLALPIVQAHAGWLAGGGVGTSANEDYDCIDCGPIGTVDDKGVGYRLFGGFQFGAGASWNFSAFGTPGFSVQLEWQQFNEVGTRDPLITRSRSSSRRY